MMFNFGNLFKFIILSNVMILTELMNKSEIKFPRTVSIEDVDKLLDYIGKNASSLHTCVSEKHIQYVRGEPVEGTMVVSGNVTPKKDDVMPIYFGLKTEFIDDLPVFSEIVIDTIGLDSGNVNLDAEDKKYESFKEIVNNYFKE